MNMPTFLQGLIILFGLKPAQAAIQYALGQATPAFVEEIGDRKDILGHRSGSSQGLCTLPAEVVAVVVQ